MDMPFIFSQEREVDNKLLTTSTVSNRFPQRPVSNARLGLDYMVSDKTVMGLILNGYDSRWSMDALTDNFSAENVQLNIQLEYVNTSSSKRIIELVKSLDNNRNVKEIKMNWFYEEDDSDMLEFGEMIQHNLRHTKTKYIEIEDDFDDEE